MAISFVNTTDYYNSGSSTSIATPAASHTTGNFIAVVVCNYSSTNHVTSITDTAGNTYVKAIQNDDMFSDSSEIWYAEDITGNANNIVTAHWGSLTSYRYICVMQFSGIETSSSLDVTSGNDNSSTTSHTSGTNTTNQNDELIIGGYMGTQLENISAGTNFTMASSDTTSVYDGAEYRIVSSTGTYAATLTTGSTTASSMVMATFKMGAEAAGAILTTNSKFWGGFP